jgi:hypothetical protein
LIDIGKQALRKATMPSRIITPILRTIKALAPVGNQENILYLLPLKNVVAGCYEPRKQIDFCRCPINSIGTIENFYVTAWRIEKTGGEWISSMAKP